jgi:chromosomal replication initiation ATPase DnaA
MRETISIISRYFGTDPFAPNKLGDVILCRQFIYYFLRHDADPESKIKFSYLKIARKFKKHHTTIMNAVSSLEGYLEYDSKMLSHKIAITNIILQDRKKKNPNIHCEHKKCLTAKGSKTA